jgi:4-amino-4-deoxy-L-arabinose transferase-like glycosyltransferase
MDESTEGGIQRPECGRIGDPGVDRVPSISTWVRRAGSYLGRDQRLGFVAAAASLIFYFPMNMRTRTDILLLVAFCGFLFFYGLGAFGLLGADEPRYAQVAREMLDRHDWVTPTLQGKPWLEKPPLYYWQAMLAFAVYGVSDRAARMPAALDAVLLIAAVYLFLRRFRPGSEIDGALIAAGCAGMIGFARAAATDMPLAAMFAIAMLAWYAWYESRVRLFLAAFYIFIALGTLAKGPVAPFLAGVILLIFAGLKRDWRILLRTLWIPGILLFLVVAMPWYVAVQLRNPEFFRTFILEHNLARFGQDLYHHRQPFWFYLPVLLLSLMPWTLWAVAAVVERLRLVWSEGKNAFSRDEDSWQLFLLIWLLVPVLFFSASQSKLPGYILPAIPAGALLVSNYLAIRRENESKISPWLAGLHAALCGSLIFGALTAPGIILNHRLVWGTGSYIAVAVAAVVTVGIAGVLLLRAGLRWLRFATMVPIVVGVSAILRLASPMMDATLSARPIARAIQGFSQETVPIGVYHLNRSQEYGLEFYLNRGVQHYGLGQIPQEGHVLITARNTIGQVIGSLPARKVSRLTTIPTQKLDVFWVAPAPTAKP